MEEYNTHIQLQDIDEEEAEDALSLCDLPLHHDDDHYSTECDDLPKYTTPSSDQDFFEFLTNPTSQAFLLKDNFIFCGKTIPYEHQTARSESFRKPPPRHGARLNAALRSSSLRLPTSKPCGECVDVSVRRVPINTYGSTSSKSSRRHVFTFGLAKFPPEMDLSDIKKRQSRRTPAPMFPAADGGEIVTGNGRGSGRGHWGLLRPLRCRAHLASALARASFGCIPLV